ncbi:MAG: hypothetical protein KatS3mg008_1479 [Acidimicrobiales bacterium]|nr:MAG: hypothetical protein KatS3mg008_1479 [Acidimicrobiales bacterium]
MSEDHKKALAEGREQSAAVRRYLEALEESKPRRGRKRTPESIQKQLERINQQIASASPLRKLSLEQQRIELEQALENLQRESSGPDLATLEKDFVKAAKAYSERKGISYQAWRKVGVPADVLKKAGITRASR